MNNVPAHLKYTKTHEWVKEEAAEITVGITKHAEELLGDMVFVELPSVGQAIEAGKEFAVVESVKAASDVYAPISGVVTAVNEQLANNPALINEDPYGQGWLVKLKTNAPKELQSLLNAEQYEIEAFKEH